MADRHDEALWAALDNYRDADSNTLTMFHDPVIYLAIWRWKYAWESKHPIRARRLRRTR